MHWSDESIILDAARYGESSAILTLISREHGLWRGLVRGFSSQKQRSTFEPGNIVSATWRGRLSEQLGNFTCEPITTTAALFLQDARRLAALNSACGLLMKALPEREPNPELFEHLRHLLLCLRQGEGWEIAYIHLEMELLAQLGFGLDLSACAATGQTETLVYVSPKSGRAVSEAAGAPYRDKLLPLPAFLHRLSSPVNTKDIQNGLALTGFFLDKYAFTPHNWALPVARHQLVAYVNAVEEALLPSG